MVNIGIVVISGILLVGFMVASIRLVRRKHKQARMNEALRDHVRHIRA